ncbi:MAG: HDOD domain-containing protein [Hydrogenophilales bacterium]|nr:HDOD domain-containing protein [Hydrogenophilales bacterium]
MPDLSSAAAEKLLAGITIPPRPSVVTAVMEERAKTDPNPGRIAQLIANDVGLSAAVLKTINSPFYGLRRRIASIDEAVALLGMKNIGTLVIGHSLSGAIPSKGLERFWDSAARTALIASHLAKTLGAVSREDAHLLGLFHDCGIPLLLDRFPDYKVTLQLANNERSRSFTDVEDERHGTNHSVVGALLAANWKLPTHIRDAIANNHDLGIFGSSMPSEVLNLIATVHIAEYIENSYSRLSTDCEWEKQGVAVMTQLMIDEESVEEMARDAVEMIERSGL